MLQNRRDLARNGAIGPQIVCNYRDQSACNSLHLGQLRTEIQKDIGDLRRVLERGRRLG